MEDFKTLVIKTAEKVDNIEKMLERVNLDNSKVVQITADALKYGEANARHILRLEENLRDNIKEIKANKSEDHKIIWENINQSKDKINDHSSKFSWLVGIGLGLQIAWALVWKFVKPE